MPLLAGTLKLAASSGLARLRIRGVSPTETKTALAMTQIKSGSQWPVMSKKPITLLVSVMPEMASPNPKSMPEINAARFFMLINP